MTTGSAAQENEPLGLLPVDDGWLRTALAVVDFRTDSGRLPSTGATDDDAERSLARWLRTQRELDRAGRLVDRRRAWLDERVPGWRNPLDDTWRIRAAAVARYRLESGRFPAANAADREARGLGMWLRTQRRALRDGKLLPHREEWLSRNLPNWEDPYTDVWLAKAEATAHFAADAGRLPSLGEDRDETERELAGWLRTQRAIAREDRLPDERRAWLDDALPGWADPYEAAWFQTVEAAARYRETHGRLPRAGGADAEERRLGTWLTKQRTHALAGTLQPARAARLDERLPDWRAPKLRSWHSRAEEAAEFVARHERLPARRAAAEPGELELAVWLGNQRAADREGRLDEARRRWLDERLPGWSLVRKRHWHEKAEAVARFEAEHGRLPGALESDPDARTLGLWLSRQRKAAKEGRLAPDRERWLRMRVPGWRSPYFNVWVTTAERVMRFRSDHGRLPSRRTNGTPLERELGVWLNNQRCAARDERLSPERRRWLDEQIPEWFDPHFAIWLANANAVAAYRGRTGRLPYFRSPDPELRRLGGWLNNQRTAQKAGRLPERRAAWLDRHLPGWAEGNDAIWARNSDAAAQFHSYTGQFPRRRSDDPVEAKLGTWLDHQIAREGRGRLRQDRRRWLDDHLPGWDERTA